MSKQLFSSPVVGPVELVKQSCRDIRCAVKAFLNGDEKAVQTLYEIAQSTGYVPSFRQETPTKNGPSRPVARVLWNLGELQKFKKVVERIPGHLLPKPYSVRVQIFEGIDGAILSCEYNGRPGFGFAAACVWGGDRLNFKLGTDIGKLVHETGHVVHQQQGFRGFHPGPLAKRTVTGYSPDNPNENFAQNYADYFDSPLELLIGDPELYRFNRDHVFTDPSGKRYEYLALANVPGFYPKLFSKGRDSLAGQALKACIGSADRVNTQAGSIGWSGKSSSLNPRELASALPLGCLSVLSSSGLLGSASGRQADRELEARAVLAQLLRSIFSGYRTMRVSRTKAELLACFGSPEREACAPIERALEKLDGAQGLFPN